MLSTLRILFSNRKTSTHPAIWPRREDLGKADLKARAGVPERAREHDLGDGTQKRPTEAPECSPTAGRKRAWRRSGIGWTAWTGRRSTPISTPRVGPLCRN